MNRLNKLFNEKQTRILSVFFTAGFPELDSTVEILTELQNAGVDMVEIGIPFSDPLADGPVIQRSSEIALKNGMNLRLLFEQLKNFRNKIHIPLVLMGYLNPVLQFGIKKFAVTCNEIGIDGVILPDLPIKEYERDYQELFRQNNLSNIFLVTPQTSESRLKKIDELSDAFIYLVSSSSTTGTRTGFSEQQLNYFERIKNVRLNNPTLIGFGISDNQSFDKVCEYANGAIVGSAFIKQLEKSAGYGKITRDFVNSVKSGQIETTI